MSGFDRVYLNLWREMSLAGNASDCARALVSKISIAIPVNSIQFFRVDVRNRQIQRLPIDQSTSTVREEPPDLERISGTTWRKMLAWIKAGQLIPFRADRLEQAEHAWIKLVVGASQYGLIGPLCPNDHAMGIAKIELPTKQTLVKTQIAFFQDLLELLAILFERLCREQEEGLTRAAAEAERQSLFVRLGQAPRNDDLVGTTTGLKWVMERVNLVAPLDVPVLLLGDTGTGKEVVSRAIHNRSSRSKGPFLRVNCGAIPSELIDSQLFGHEKGSFTGAGELRQGWFERANHGTLFLDEIAELPLAAQVRLLRVLQDHQFERVGGQEPIHVDVRIIAATHRDLASLVSQRAFREDLWFRINVFPILLPRLAERVQDIPDLARHFAQRAAVRFGLNYVELTASDLLLLQGYTWPGNIRELHAVIDRAAILGNGKTMDVAKALGVGLDSKAKSIENLVTKTDDHRHDVVDEIGEIASLDRAMRLHIERALSATYGQIDGSHGAARLLKINPHTLRARMRKLKITWAAFRRGG